MIIENSFPKISIITVSFNSDKTIEETIKSVEIQKYKNIEYIIVDGCSRDNTISIIKQYKDVVSNWISEPDDGIYDAMNKGIGLCTGDIIYFLNSDDILKDEDVITDVAKLFSENQELDVVYGKVNVWDPIDNYSSLAGESFELESIKNGYMPPHQGIFMKKSLMLKVGGFDKSLKIAADFDLIIKARLFSSKWSFINRTIAIFRIGGISSTFHFDFKPFKEKKNILRKHFGIIYNVKYSVKCYMIYIPKSTIRYVLNKYELLTLYRRVIKNWR